MIAARMRCSTDRFHLRGQQIHHPFAVVVEASPRVGLEALDRVQQRQLPAVTSVLADTTALTRSLAD